MVSRRTVLKTMAASLSASTMPTASAGRTASRSKIRIGQFGTTHAHASKLSVYRASEDYEVVGLVEPDAKRREAAEQNAVFKGLPWMTAEQLLNQPGLQAVLVETDVCDLLSNAEPCVQAGMHVHIDKPAGESHPTLEDTEVFNEGYKVDNFVDRLALDVEWNAKDGNLDRDLSAYRALYDAALIDVAVIITRTGVLSSEAKRMSRLVTMPSTRPVASTTGKPVML